MSTERSGGGRGAWPVVVAFAAWTMLGLSGCQRMKWPEPPDLNRNVELVLESWNAVSQLDGFLLAEGAVTNVSGRPMSGVTAVISFYNEDKSLAFTQEAYLDTARLEPGATTTFRLETLEEESDLDATSLRFLSRDGERIRTIQREKYDRRAGFFGEEPTGD